MYPKKAQKFGLRKSFTLVEVIVVMGVMGLVISGLLVSMRQIIEGEMLLKKMHKVEEESRFILDLFAQDSQYSELDDKCKPIGVNTDWADYFIDYLLVQRKEEISESANEIIDYRSYFQGKDYYLQRNIINGPDNLTVTLNNTPLKAPPIFRVRKLATGVTGSDNYMITISLIFQVENRNAPIFIPLQISVVSRTFAL